jgi:glutamine amidotransferase PdxT
MNRYKRFNEEVTIRGNKAIPGQGQPEDMDPNDVNYLSNLEDEELRRVGLNRGDVDNMRKIHEIGPQMMDLVSRAKMLSQGKEKRLEKLAIKVIRNMYGEILKDTLIDIKYIIDNRGVGDFIEEEKEVKKKCKKCADIPEPKDISFSEIKDPVLLNRIQRAKIGYVITQGEAKNTKTIIQSGEVKDELRKIFKSDFDVIYGIWMEIVRLAEQLDWVYPSEAKAKAMEENPEGMAGAVSVNLMPKKDIENIEDMDSDDEFDVSEVEDDDIVPTIRAVGVDFPMLLHEAVKGVFQIITAQLIPSGTDEDSLRMTNAIKLNVSYEDEVEDFRTGPKIAADLRDFINENKNANPIIRVYVFGVLMNPEELSDEEFLKIFRGILNKTAYARRWVDNLIEEIREELEEFGLYDVLEGLPRRGYEFGNEDIEDVKKFTKSKDFIPSFRIDDFDDEDVDEEEDLSFEGEYKAQDDDGGDDYGFDFDFDDDSDDDGGYRLDDDDSEAESNEEDFSKLSKRDIQKRIDDALSDRDFEMVKKLSAYLENVRYQFKKNSRL